ncbi:MAG TPA: hypothetical protein VEC14_06700, partial [Reyranellaceae bacterium]|nr:hypothetical protein [Reyranellaceae bacterium]
TGYVGLAFLIVALAALRGSSGATRLTAPIPHLPVLLVLGAIAAALLLVPASYAYTGRGPWEMLDALRDQGGAYRRLQAQLWATEGQRNMIVAMRAFAAPVTFAVLPLGIIHWRSIGIIGRLAVVVTVLASITFSILCGTDKEIADLFVIGIAAAFVAYGRSRTFGHQGFELVRRFWKPALVALVFVYFAQGLFTDRKDARLGGYVSRTAVCANESRICADLENPWISWLPLRQRFGTTFFILSTSSGYYGLALALEKPFESAYGIGHSPAATSVYETVSGDRSLHMRTYTYRNGADRWSEEFYWSTLITWIANDVGFVGALAVLGLVAYLWGRWWREAAAGMSDPAAVLFAAATMMMVYLPANNQLLASYDGYTVLAVWIGVWLWHRRSRGLTAVVTS